VRDGPPPFRGGIDIFKNVDYTVHRENRSIMEQSTEFSKKNNMTVNCFKNVLKRHFRNIDWH